MEITLNQVGRRFNREWIFKNVSYLFQSGKSYAILGINGSGKSTLLQIISGSLSLSFGKIEYQLSGKKVELDNIFQHLSIAAPYLDLIEDFTLTEIIDFHFQFKARLNNLSNKEIIALLDMEKSKDKQLKYFSSGMRQRVKLVLAFCSNTKILLLDEPTSNLDEQGIKWYKDLIAKFIKNRLVIVCSNQPYEYDFCDAQIHISSYK